jgi:hypothetical protein
MKGFACSDRQAHALLDQVLSSIRRGIDYASDIMRLI